MHCFWLIQGISKLQDWHKQVSNIQNVCATMKKHCGKRLFYSVRQLRIDFSLVLRLALAKKSIMALALARLELALYKIATRF